MIMYRWALQWMWMGCGVGQHSPIGRGDPRALLKLEQAVVLKSGSVLPPGDF